MPDRSAVISSGLNLTSPHSYWAIYRTLPGATESEEILRLGPLVSLFGWSIHPDGSELALVLYNWQDDEAHSVQSFDLEDRAMLPIWSGALEQTLMPAWHPDGKRLAAVQPEGEGVNRIHHVVMFDFRGTVPRLDTLVSIQVDRGGVVGLAFSPDGQKLVFGLALSGGDRRADLKMLDLTRPGPPMSLGIEGLNPAYSPDGAWVGYEDISGGDPVIQAWRVADGERRSLLGDDQTFAKLYDWR